MANLSSRPLVIAGFYSVAQRWKTSGNVGESGMLIQPHQSIFSFYTVFCDSNVSAGFEAEKWTSQNIETFIDEGKITKISQPSNTTLQVCAIHKVVLGAQLSLLSNLL